MSLRTPTRRPGLAPLLLLLLLAGCSGPRQYWVKPGHAQVDFDRDSQECDLLARDLARQATMTGKREDPATYSREYQSCLAARGWRALPGKPETTKAPAGRPALASITAGVVQGFGRTFPVPAGFALQSDTRTEGPTLLQTLMFRGPAATYLNLVFQQGLTREFEPVDYPVRAPFFLYEKGRAARQPGQLRWALFAGLVQKNWVVGLGGYLLLADRERVMVVITKPLPPAEQAPAAGLRLSPGQFAAVEQFRSRWLPWLEKQAR